MKKKDLEAYLKTQTSTADDVKDILRYYDKQPGSKTIELHQDLKSIGWLNVDEEIREFYAEEFNAKWGHILK